MLEAHPGNLVSITAQPHIVLITGASSGIGKVTSLYLAAKGYVVIGTSRRLERLVSLFDEAEARGLRVFGVELDPNSDESVGGVMPDLIVQFGRIDALVNNAGFGVWGPVDSLSIDELKLQFEANFFGAVRMVHAVLPQMLSRRSGHIVNISSILGRMGTPFNGAYVASKYALEGLSESLRAEVRPFGVHVSLVEPGLFATAFQNNQLRAARSADPSSVYAPYVARYNRRHDQFDRLASDPIKVARVIEKALRSRRPAFRYPVSLEARVGIVGTKLLPERLFHALLDRVTLGRGLRSEE